MKKNRAAKIKETAQPNQADVMNEALNFLMGLPEIAEAFTRADLELALDDRGWITSGQSGNMGNDLDDQTRKTLVQKSRLYWQRDPLAKQSVRLWTDYALGDGMTYKAEDPEVQKTLDQFCKNRRNRGIMNSEGQRKSSKKCLIDGEVFFAIFTEPDDSKTIRRIDPLQITDIISDPDDEEHVIGYKRVTGSYVNTAAKQEAGKTLFYADWKCDEADIEMLKQQRDPAGSVIGDRVQEDVVIYHVAFDSLEKRGNGLLFPVCDWSKEHRRFMEARVAIVQALSKFAWKTTVKGGQGIVNQLKAKVESSYAQSGVNQPERHPQTAPASTWVQNAGIDTTPMPRTTGGGDAQSDGNQLKLMVSAGTGIMLHYYGDPSTGNLATATAMELPMLKMFKSYQKFWTDIYHDLFCIVLDQGQENDEEESDDEIIDVDLPPILDDDLQKLGAFLTSASAMFPELKVKEVLVILLQSLGVNNIDEVLKACDAKRTEIESNVKAGKNPDGSPIPQPVGLAAGGKKPAITSKEAAALTEAISNLTALLK